MAQKQYSFDFILNAVLNGPDKPREEAPAQQKESSEDTGDGRKWLEIQLDSAQQHVIRVAREQGKNVFGLTVTVQESCILKAARAFLVFKAVEERGEIIVSNPPAQDVEDEKFDLDFSLIVVSDGDIEAVKAAVASVSEIASVVGETIVLEDMGTIDKYGDSIPEPEQKPQPASEEPVQAAAQQPETAHVAEPASKPAPASKTGDKKQAPGKPVVNRTVRVDIEKLDVLMNLVSELIIAKNSLVSVSNQVQGQNQGVNEQIEYLENVTTNLHESVMKVRMVPIESVVSKFPRMIRDLSKKLDKKMELYMTGEETELDRTVVDEIGDPLMHLLRNSADHGLESAEIRAQRGKPAVGSIFLDAYQDGNNVVIEVRDDGNGIDVEKVKAKALEREAITPEQAANMSDKEIIDLLFLPSFSTAKQVTDVEIWETGRCYIITNHLIKERSCYYGNH